MKIFPTLCPHERIMDPGDFDVAIEDCDICFPITVELHQDYVCPDCGWKLEPEHAHQKCPSCGYRDSCCEGAPL